MYQVIKLVFPITLAFCETFMTIHTARSFFQHVWTARMHTGSPLVYPNSQHTKKDTVRLKNNYGPDPTYYFHNRKKYSPHYDPEPKTVSQNTSPAFEIQRDWDLNKRPPRVKRQQRNKKINARLTGNPKNENKLKTLHFFRIWSDRRELRITRSAKITDFNDNHC